MNDVKANLQLIFVMENVLRQMFHATEVVHCHQRTGNVGMKKLVSQIKMFAQ
jgi:hypothetical protein